MEVYSASGMGIGCIYGARNGEKMSFLRVRRVLTEYEIVDNVAGCVEEYSSSGVEEGTDVGEESG